MTGANASNRRFFSWTKFAAHFNLDENSVHASHPPARIIHTLLFRILPARRPGRPAARSIARKSEHATTLDGEETSLRRRALHRWSSPLGWVGLATAKGSVSVWCSGFCVVGVNWSFEAHRVPVVQNWDSATTAARGWSGCESAMRMHRDDWPTRSFSDHYD
jgi:hypothetical protein